METRKQMAPEAQLDSVCLCLSWAQLSLSPRTACARPNLGKRWLSRTSARLQPGTVSGQTSHSHPCRDCHNMQIYLPQRGHCGG